MPKQTRGHGGFPMAKDAYTENSRFNTPNAYRYEGASLSRNNAEPTSLRVIFFGNRDLRVIVSDLAKTAMEIAAKESI